MPVSFNDIENAATSRAREEAGWVRGKNGGWLKPIHKGEPAAKGYRKPSNYVETLHLARKSSPAAMRTLINCLDNPDPRTAVVAANSILERAWGKPREQRPEEHREASTDLSTLTNAELALLVKLVESGRLRATPDAVPDAETEIDGVVQVVDGAQPGQQQCTDEPEADAGTDGEAEARYEAPPPSAPR